MTKEEIRLQFLAHPELMGKMFVPLVGGTAITYSMTLIEYAGGYDALIRDWVEVET